MPRGRRYLPLLIFISTFSTMLSSFVIAIYVYKDKKKDMESLSLALHNSDYLNVFLFNSVDSNNTDDRLNFIDFNDEKSDIKISLTRVFTNQIRGDICQENINTWRKFVMEYRFSTWYFKGVSDTIINTTRLFNLAWSLAQKYDPQEKIIFRYCMSFAKERYGLPEIKSGLLVSAAGIRYLLQNKRTYMDYCLRNGEQESILKLLKPITKHLSSYHSEYFIPEWPGGTYKGIIDLLTHAYPYCNDTSNKFESQGRLYNPYELVSTHINDVNIDDYQMLTGQIKNYTRILESKHDNKLMFCRTNFV